MEIGGGEYSSTRFSLMTSLLNVLNAGSQGDGSYTLAKYFLEHFRELGRLNIYDVAEECSVSRSGIRRFCQSIGYDNFSMVKAWSSEWKLQRDTAIRYVDHPDFATDMKRDMVRMMEEVERQARKQDIDSLARRLRDSSPIYLLTSDYSSMAARDFQQEMVVMGRLVYLVTDSGVGMKWPDDLGSNALLITSSATGNYAQAADKMVRGLGAAEKVLITKCLPRQLLATYDRIYCLCPDAAPQEFTRLGVRDVYTKYGMNYFFDLLYHRYVALYGKEPG